MEDKLKCLELACKVHMDPDEAVSAAEKYWQWLLNASAVPVKKVKAPTRFRGTSGDGDAGAWR